MVSGTNKFVLEGNLVKDFVVTKSKKSDKVYSSNSVAVNKIYKDVEKKEVKKTTYFPFTLWDKAAEAAAKEFKKGSWVTVSGELKYKDKYDVLVWSIKPKGKKA